MNKRFGLLVKGTILVTTLAIVPGCKFLTDLFKKKEGEKTTVEEGKKGPILLSINGKTVIWESDFKKSLNQMLQANPYFRGAGINALPMSIKKKFFEELTKQELILRDAEQQGVEGNQEFIKAYEELKALAKRSLIIQFYEKGIFDHIDVSESEKTQHFQENKDRFVKTPGGILASGAKFSSEKAADKMVSKVESKKLDEEDFLKEFDALAKDEKDAKFKNFGRVTEKAQGFGDTTPAPIREAVFALQTLPAVEKVKVGKEIWVVAATDKKDPVFFEKEEIDSQLTNMLKNNKFREQLDKKIKDLQASTKIEVNETYFEEEKAESIAANATEQKTTAVAANTQTPAAEKSATPAQEVVKA
ncbi:MAG: hypothetical protein V1855_02510 [bacterium]